MNAEEIKFCEVCGHSTKDHWRGVNDQINCQICEREGQTCG